MNNVVIFFSEDFRISAVYYFMTQKIKNITS